MNFLLFALGVNLLTLANAVNDINFDTILKILEPKQRQVEDTNIEEINIPVEVIPIIPGFYEQKSEDITPSSSRSVESLFENPKDWPDDAANILSSDAIRQSKKNINPKTKNKSKGDDYLNKKILKAVRNLNKYRESQKHKRHKLRKIKKQHKAGSGKARKTPIKKMLGRMFRGLKDSSYSRQKKAHKKPQFRAANEASDAKVLGDLLKNIINGNKDYNKSPVLKKHAYLIESEERDQEGGDFLEDILNTAQNNNQDLEIEETEETGNYRYQQQPNLIIISTGPLQDDDLEMENNAKESMEVFDEDYDRSKSLNQPTRRSIGEKDEKSSVSSSTDTDDSSYERNPGNPFTVHKNKYKQNWPYNHYMDGDHMNINPFGPQFGQMGPTGPELFFGRKWWYFNQDDFKPMG